MPSRFKTLLIMAPCRRLQFNLSDMYPVPRLGLGYLSAYLKAHGYPRVTTRDIIAERAWIPEILEQMASEGPPDLLGLSVTILSLREAFAIAKAVKTRFPGVHTVIGGPGVGFTPEALLSYGEGVDFFVRGEGEGPLLALVQALEGGGDLGAVPGLIWRDGDLPTENAKGAFRDLGDGVTCDYDAQPMEAYRLHPPMGVFPPATMMETTRGCSFPCEFCCLSMPVRYRSPEAVEEELRRLISVYGIREVHFIDPTFSLNRSRALELAERVGRLGLRWSCKTRVDRVDAALLRAFAKSRCYLIAFGVESGDDAILGALDKRAVAESAVEAFDECRAVGIRTTAYLLVANPGESDATIEGNMAFVRRLRPDYVLYDVLQADPMNPMTLRRIEEGHFTLADLEVYYLGEGRSLLDDFTVAGHTQAQARAWLSRASGDFYVRPRYVFDKLRDLRTLQDLLNLTAGGAAFAKDALGVGRLWGLGKGKEERV